MTNPKTLARTNDPQTSKDAAKRMVDSGALNRQEQLVYNAILDSYSKDFTTKEIAERMSEFRRYADYFKWYEICRRRFSGLFDKFKIVLTGERREGCRIWRLL